MKTIIHNIGTLYTFQHEVKPVKKENLDQCLTLTNAFIVIEDDLITAIGSGSYDKYFSKDCLLHDALQAIVLPGLIDAHTHLVHGGSREHEYALKLDGVAYLDILKQGGGILNTVNATRNASFDELYDKAYFVLDQMLLHGVTTLEAKSGYGLNVDTEIKQLEVAHKLANNHPCDLVHTFMPAHAIPPEYKGNTKGYIDLIINDMLPLVKAKNLANYVDIFCEDGVFNAIDSKTILEAALKEGFKVKIHADEVVPMGGTKLAAQLKTLSAEHLMASTVEDIKLLGANNVIANLLPATSFNLQKKYALAQEMIKNNVAISICSDYNPGSCPNANLQLALQIGSRGYNLSPIQTYNAGIVNAACALELDDNIGSIEVGKKADIIIMNAPNIEYTIYSFGINHVRDVFKNGKLVVEKQRLIY